jgi:nucleotide-binding universal stress UspA family protein
VTVHSIVSAVDFSEQSRQALRWAGAFAARFQSRLTVISVVDPLLADAARIRLNLDLAKEAETALRDFVAATWPNGAPTAQLALKATVGDAAAAILGMASTEGVDLITAGTQGLGGLRKWLLGSTTERLLRRTRVPVLAVPPDGAGSDDSNAGGTIEVSRILAATDFSKSSLAEVEHAAQLARHFSAKLILAHVVEPLIVPAPWRSLVQESDETRSADARARLESLAEELCRPAQDCETLAPVGRAADVIGSLAEEQQAQVIVMGLSSAQGTFAPRPGSIAYRVLTSTTVPVLVVPAQAAEGVQK